MEENKKQEIKLDTSNLQEEVTQEVIVETQEEVTQPEVIEEVVEVIDGKQLIKDIQAKANILKELQNTTGNIAFGEAFKDLSKAVVKLYQIYG